MPIAEDYSTICQQSPGYIDGSNEGFAEQFRRFGVYWLKHEVQPIDVDRVSQSLWVTLGNYLNAYPSTDDPHEHRRNASIQPLTRYNREVSENLLLHIIEEDDEGASQRTLTHAKREDGTFRPKTAIRILSGSEGTVLRSIGDYQEIHDGRMCSEWDAVEKGNLRTSPIGLAYRRKAYDAICAVIDGIRTADIRKAPEEARITWPTVES